MKRCLEKKRYLSGAEVTFACNLVALEKGFGILKHVIDRQWQVSSLTLRPGSVTYAFYWTDRPYNLYWWLDEGGETLGHYFNLADSVSLSPHEFVWRDLVVDILLLPSGQVQVIDEDELPGDLNEGLKVFIASAKQQVLQNHSTIIEDARATLARRLKGSKQ
jgi:predicted RNA-binding protein associated with RNAse of E/G family